MRASDPAVPMSSGAAGVPQARLVGGWRHVRIGLGLLAQSPHGCDEEVGKGERHGPAEVQDPAAERRCLLAGSGCEPVEGSPGFHLATVEDLGEDLVALEGKPGPIPEGPRPRASARLILVLPRPRSRSASARPSAALDGRHGPSRSRVA